MRNFAGVEQLEKDPSMKWYWFFILKSKRRKFVASIFHENRVLLPFFLLIKLLKRYEVSRLRCCWETRKAVVSKGKSFMLKAQRTVVENTREVLQSIFKSCQPSLLWSWYSKHYKWIKQDWGIGKHCDCVTLPSLVYGIIFVWPSVVLWFNFILGLKSIFPLF